jgi:hypothetical protein
MADTLGETRHAKPLNRTQTQENLRFSAASAES